MQYLFKFYFLTIIIVCFVNSGRAQLTARNDFKSMNQGDGITTVNVLQNDTYAVLFSRSIIQQGRYGFAVFDEFNNFIYTQTSDICNVNDTLKYRICSSANSCTSASVVITINCVGFEMKANDDEYNVSDDLVSALHVTANDVLPFDSIRIVQPPIIGTIVSLNSKQVIYSKADTCDLVDVFTYAICNSVKCDTAEVVVYYPLCVAKPNITVYNAVSPNGDGKNDVLFIAGMELYKSLKVTIFNRWGQVVYEKNGYDNSWSGKDNSGKELEDGTYYYIIDLGELKSDIIDKKILTGQIALFR